MVLLGLRLNMLMGIFVVLFVLRIWFSVLENFWLFNLVMFLVNEKFRFVGLINSVLMFVSVVILVILVKFLVVLIIIIYIIVLFVCVRYFEL